MRLTFEEFIIALEAEIKAGARAEQALRMLVNKMADQLREKPAYAAWDVKKEFPNDPYA